MIEIKTVTNEIDEQMKEQESEKNYNKVMDASMLLAKIASDIRRNDDLTKSNARAVTVDFESRRVFFTYDA